MSFIRRAASTFVERRGAPGNLPWGDSTPPPPSLVGSNAAGIPVTQQTAEGIAAVYGCCALLADSVSSLPMELRSGPTRKDSKQLTLSPLLAQPYAEISRRDWWVQFIWALALRGNFYGRVVERDRMGNPVQIKPIHNDAVQVWRDKDTGAIVYRFYGELVPFRDVIHIRYQSTGGNIIGLNPIQTLALSFGIAVAQERHTESFFLNSANPMGVIEVPGYLDRTETRKMMRAWLAAHQGLNNSNMPAVLTEGAEFKPISISPQDAQLLEALQFSESKICGRIFRVPPHMVGIVDRATCLPGDSPVFTTQGPKAMSEVQAGEQVWSLGADGIERASVVSQNMTGIVPLLTVETAGRSVRLTANHVVPVRRRFGLAEGRKSGQCGWDNLWLRADELRPGDYLMLAHGFGDQVGGETADPSGRELTVEAMEFAGLYTGDGSCGKPPSRRIEIAHGEGVHGEHMPYYREAIAGEFLARVVIKPTGRCTRFYSREAYDWLHESGFTGYAHTKRVPGWVFGLRRDLQLAYLRGYLDSDGCVLEGGRVAFKCVNRELLEDVRHLCIQVGLPVARIVKAGAARKAKFGERTINCREQYGLTLGNRSLNAALGSHCPRKRERLEAAVPSQRPSSYHPGWRTEPVSPSDHNYTPGKDWDCQGVVLQRIRRITRGKVAVPVYDLAVSGNHTFLAEGGVGLHNSWGRLTRN